MKYLICLVLTFLFFLNIAQAGQEAGQNISLGQNNDESSQPDDRSWLDKAAQAIDNKIISPMKQNFDTMNREQIQEQVQQESQNIMNQVQEQVQNKAEEKALEIKNSIATRTKQAIKNWAKRRAENVKSLMSPLKNGVQQGTGWVRERVRNIWIFIFSASENNTQSN